MIVKYKIKSKKDQRLEFKDLMAFKSRKKGFFYEYKKNRPRMLLDKEPARKKTWFETFIEDRERQAEDQRKAKEKKEEAERLRLAD